jgi:hypothetical protein
MYLSKYKKNIKFSKYKYIHFIPNLNYYINENLINEVWYSVDNINNFKNNSIIEIKELINKHKNMSVKDAIYLLYENTKIIYNPAFFLN